MNLAELLANESVRREEFPVARDKVFLAHAGVCPLPRRVIDAISRYTSEASRGDQEHFVYPGVLDEARREAAQLLRARADEIALVGPTSLALSFVASGMKWRRSDNVLIYFDDYPSNVYPWMALADQGVEVRLMNTRGLGMIRPMDVMGQVDENTRLVALASCHFISGYRIQITEIGQFLRARGILSCVDGIQTLGAFPTSVEYVDMLAADAHKWLLGPCAAGILYVRREVQDRLNPPVYGWHNVHCPGFVAQERIVLRKDARKYEAGTHNLLGVIGMMESMRLIQEMGVDEIAKELLRKRTWLVRALQEMGYTVLHPDLAAENASAIVSITDSRRDMASLHQTLANANVITSLRKDRAGNSYIRFSPHFYNSDEELQRAVALLK